jgi:hypothetical protein
LRMFIRGMIEKMLLKDNLQLWWCGEMGLLKYNETVV